MFPAGPLVTSVSRKAQCSPKRFQQVAERAEVAADLLHRHDVEAGDDLRNAGHVAEVSLRRVSGPGCQLLVSPPKARRFQVPIRRLRSAFLCGMTLSTSCASCASATPAAAGVSVICSSGKRLPSRAWYELPDLSQHRKPLDTVQVARVSHSPFRGLNPPAN